MNSGVGHVDKETAERLIHLRRKSRSIYGSVEPPDWVLLHKEHDLDELTNRTKWRHWKKKDLVTAINKEIKQSAAELEYTLGTGGVLDNHFQRLGLVNDNGTYGPNNLHKIIAHFIISHIKSHGKRSPYPPKWSLRESGLYPEPKSEEKEPEDYSYMIPKYTVPPATVEWNEEEAPSIKSYPKPHTTKIKEESKTQLEPDPDPNSENIVNQMLWFFSNFYRELKDSRDKEDKYTPCKNAVKERIKHLKITPSIVDGIPCYTPHHLEIVSKSIDKQPRLTHSTFRQPRTSNPMKTKSSKK